MAIIVPVLGRVRDVDKSPETARPLARAITTMPMNPKYSRVFISLFSPGCGLVLVP